MSEPKLTEELKDLVDLVYRLDQCENCFRSGVTKDGICVFCGCGPKIGGE